MAENVEKCDWASGWLGALETPIVYYFDGRWKGFDLKAFESSTHVRLGIECFVSEQW
jgi:hypothetical protein